MMENLFDKLRNQLPQQAVDEQAPVVADNKTPMASLSTDDLVALWQKHQDDADATEEVLRRMRPTISSAINSYAKGMDDKLAVKAARLTLDALRTYDPSRGANPATYVFHSLKRLNRLGARAQNIIPQSEYASAESRLVREAFDRFVDDRGRDPSMSELADLTGLSVRKLEKVLDRGAVVNESATLTEDSRKDTIGQSDLTDDDYFEYVYASVDPINQKIMEWSSGKHGVRPLSNNQIAAKLHISPAAVSQRRGKIQGMLSDARSLV